MSFQNPYDHALCAVQEWHAGSAVYGRRPTSAGTHHHPGSVSSTVRGALRPDVDPGIGPHLTHIIPRASVRDLSVCRYFHHILWGWLFPLQRGLLFLENPNLSLPWFPSGLYLSTLDLHF